MNIVIVGHVDHGKSTVIGRLMADTESLPQGKLEQVKAHCAKNARPFEYAFLLDALKEEQSQGITIDTARCFFKTSKRDYILIDAPGHVEFLKNMVTGAARAEAAVLVIDAKEGIQENTRRHGYLLSLLGVRQIAVLVNKMDLVNRDMSVFKRVQEEYSAFLAHLDIHPTAFVPICARDGENIVDRAPWYKGPTVLECIDGFVKETGRGERPFRLPVQDIYKFTEDNDDRRIIAGTVESGNLRVGDGVVFLPSHKKSKIKTIEAFNRPNQNVIEAGLAAGVTLHDELYIKPGEIISKEGENLPLVGTRFRANLLWLGKSPFIRGQRYKLKLGSARAVVQLAEVLNVLDASSLSSVNDQEQVNRNDVAECILETTKPIAFDPVSTVDATGRFVIVDNYEIAGGGVVLENVSDGRSALLDHIRRREAEWVRSAISPNYREYRYGHKPKFILLTGPKADDLREIGLALERRLFEEGRNVYFLSDANFSHGLDSGTLSPWGPSDEHIRRLGELARIMTDSGQIFIAGLANAEPGDMTILKALNSPHPIFIVKTGEPHTRDGSVDLEIDALDISTTVDRIYDRLRKEQLFFDYCI